MGRHAGREGRARRKVGRRGARGGMERETSDKGKTAGAEGGGEEERAVAEGREGAWDGPA